MSDKTEQKDTPNPGSDEAIALGCRCAAVDNGHGRGAWGGIEIDDGKVWVMHNGCPLHGIRQAVTTP